jgi:hypothetical protein
LNWINKWTSRDLDGSRMAQDGHINGIQQIYLLITSNSNGTWPYLERFDDLLVIDGDFP